MKQVFKIFTKNSIIKKSKSHMISLKTKNFNRMKHLFKIINILTITFLLFSCEDVVDVTLNDEDLDLMVVEAYISTKTKDNIYVKVTSTTEVDDTSNNPVISNAVVQLTDDADTPNSVTLEEQGSTGIYLLPEGTSYPGISGRTYTLSITTSDGTVITAEEYLKEVPTLDTVKVNLYSMIGEEYLGVFVCSPETEEEGDYYKWDMYINSEELTDISELMYASDDLVDGNYISNLMLLLDWEDEEEDQYLHMGDTVIVEQLSISEAAYDFYCGLSNQESTGSIFSVPPANVPGNLTSSDGKTVLGIFSARDVSVGNTVIIDESNYTLLDE